MAKKKSEKKKDRKDNLLKTPKPETLFSKDNQPSPEAKSEGWKRKKLIREISEELLRGDAKETFRKVAEFFGQDVDNIDMVTAMHLKQIEKAIKKGDTFAYNAILDRLQGKPVQSILTEEKNVKPVVFKIIGDDKKDKSEE